MAVLFRESKHRVEIIFVEDLSPRAAWMARVVLVVLDGVFVEPDLREHCHGLTGLVARVRYVES